MSFTSEEIKEIKYGKRLGYVFSFIILLFGTLFILHGTIVQNVEFWDIKIIGLVFLTIGLIVLILYGMNRKIYKDLKLEDRLIETKKIEKREKTIAYEVGSGSLHIPLLGNLFPKIWGQEMKGHETFQLTINGEEYNVEEDFFNKVKEGDKIELHWAKYSEIFLGLKIKK